MDNISPPKIQARITAVQDDIVTLEAVGGSPLRKNEVIYVLPERGADKRQERLKGEILRIRGDRADAQVFESTRGVGVGDAVELSGELLSVSLGPGLLGQVYDGLQNPLAEIAEGHGYFLPRGIALPALNPHQKWAFTPKVRIGSELSAGQIVGTVQEGRFCHRIMIPFDEPGRAVVEWIQEGSVTVTDPVARIRDADGESRLLTLQQRWPVRRAIPETLLRTGRCERLYPDRPLVTTLRLVDSFFPIAQGGTACIPGPFGAGKTVLQQLISRNSSADIVIIVACGERAGEVVETITEFPGLSDPQTGGSLMDRTIIICNTSSMPVAAREASIYTGITLGEYYRQMGFNVLLLADSTSRWAQAMRETSGRLEEIPGEEAFPAYLDSAIRGLYERAGVIQVDDDTVGSLTLIGTVSPAGGNFEEPVTQSTLSTVKCFLGLSAARAYRRFYPAVDPLLSWSRYLDQLGHWYENQLEPGWSARIKKLQRLLKEGDGVQQMMQVTGEEGVTLEDYVTYQKALFLDMVYLQQDAYDPVDVSTPLERQRTVLARIDDLISRGYAFPDKDTARDYFTRLTGLFRNLNYAATHSPDYKRLWCEIEELADKHEERPDQMSHPA